MSDPQPTTLPEPLHNSPWLWACIFSGMGLFMLVMMNRRIDQRQAQIEEKEHNRKVAREFQASQAAGKTAAEPDAPPATGGEYWQRQISVRPLIIFFACAVAVSAVGFVWEQIRIRQPPREEPEA
ncbi:MAG: hypothetical protein IIA67_08415 [Planctomycetes bacterium]|nr:hypothetical protein [Planctomycetota bacterium]